MARITIKDLPKDQKIAPQELRKIRGGNVSYQQYTVSNPLLLGCNIGGTGGEDKLTETVTLNFSEMKMTYAEQSHDGTGSGDVDADWDISGNTDS
jgi:type VI secretion system secreted protein Hcp